MIHMLCGCGARAITDVTHQDDTVAMLLPRDWKLVCDPVGCAIVCPRCQK